MELRQNTPDALVHFSDYLLERYGLAATMQVALVASHAYHAVAIVVLVDVLTGASELKPALMVE